MEQFYYRHDHQVCGPVPLEFIIELQQDGLLHEQTMIRRENTPDWEPLKTFLPSPGKASETDPPSPSPPPPPTNANLSSRGEVSTEPLEELHTSHHDSLRQQHSLLYRGIFALGLAAVFVAFLFVGAALLDKAPQTIEDEQAESRITGNQDSLETQQKLNHLAQTQRILQSLRDLRNLRREIREERLRQLEANVLRAGDLFAEEEILEFYNNLTEDLHLMRSLFTALQEIETSLQEENGQSEIFAKRMQRAELLDEVEKLENSFASYQTYLQDRL
ncbi:MAG: DUF4339 domain-containing protein [Opitutales bacterium]|nr:DUF4339 domain-containing protein [Opitutales bacterium]MCH8540486.1 DUF4339 domain-containing protein [Opitutales bacterium]